MKLLIVESPAKCKTIQQYLSKDYKVIASNGHIRELKKNVKSINVDNFTFDYQLSEGKIAVINQLSQFIKKADEIYIATDHDREGEAIGWSINEVFAKEIGNKPLKRITFNEITKNAIIESLNSPRNLNQNIIDAYKARLTFDFLVGFNLSPIVWRSVPLASSVGRVQSPALRALVARDKEIKDFISTKYWSIVGYYDDNEFSLINYDNQEITNDFSELVLAEQAYNNLKSDNDFTVTAITHSKLKKTPKLPFTTSSLQIFAVNNLNFTVKKTMMVAQNLYEGITINNELVPLITYMRTDSTTISKEAVVNIESFITKKFGANEYCLRTKTKTKSKVPTQEAHEAIRPVNFNLEPETIKDKLSTDQYELYNAIWQHTIGYYMTDAINKITTVILSNNQNAKFKCVFSNPQELGWKKVFNIEKVNKPINFSKGDKLSFNEIKLKEHVTQPKPYFTESSLVKWLETNGIGRPSTYSYIISTLRNRNYVIPNKKELVPTQSGKNLISFLQEHFEKYTDYNSTAILEQNLDLVSKNETSFLKVVTDFWNQIKLHIDNYVLSGTSLCPTCHQKFKSVLGRYGWFAACENYPKCKVVKNLKKITDFDNEV